MYYRIINENKQCNILISIFKLSEVFIIFVYYEPKEKSRIIIYKKKFFDIHRFIVKPNKKYIINFILWMTSYSEKQQDFQAIKIY